MATRCFCPPESFDPPSPTSVKMPTAGSPFPHFLTKSSRFASVKAANTSASVASGFPARTLSRIEPLNSTGSWVTTPTCSLHQSMSSSWRGIPSTRTDPPASLLTGTATLVSVIAPMSATNLPEPMSNSSLPPFALPVMPTSVGRESGGATSGSPSPGGGQTSLAMLVQQRELQNSRKLESLVLKNDELVEASIQAEQERRQLIERLDYIDSRLTETCTSFMALRRDSDQRHGAADSRMAYVEQGCEERFRLLEDAVKALQSGQRREEIQRWEQMALALRAVADRVGGEALLGEVANALRTADLRSERSTWSISDLFFRGRKEGGSPRASPRGGRYGEALVDEVAFLREKLRDAVSRLDQVSLSSQRDQGGFSGESDHSRLGAVESKLEAADSRLTSILETQVRGEAQRTQHFQESLTLGASLDGRLKTAESILVQLQDRVSSASSMAASNQGRTEGLETRISRVEGQESKLAELEGVTRAATVRIEHVQERLDGIQNRGQKQDEGIGRLQQSVQQLADELSVADEKRRQLQREHDERAQQQEEKLKGINTQLEDLGERVPLVDDTRMAALCAELDRGKDVLETIVRRHELKLRENTAGMDARLLALEKDRSFPGTAVRAHSVSAGSDRHQSPVRRPLTPPAAGIVMRNWPAPLTVPPAPAHLPAPVPSPPRTSLPYATPVSASAPVLASQVLSGFRPGSSPPTRPGADTPAPNALTAEALRASGASSGPPALAGAGLDRSGSGASVRSTSPGITRRAGPGGSPAVSRTLTAAAAFPPFRGTAGYRAASAPSGLGGPVSPTATDRTRSPYLRPELEAVKQTLHEKLSQSKGEMENRRQLEMELEKVDQQLSYIKLAFQALSEKEGTLDTSRVSVLEQLSNDDSEKAILLRSRMTRLMDDIRRDKRNVYDREKALLDDSRRLRAQVSETRERERKLAEEMQSLQKRLMPALGL
eukprot:Hpha_TRINITY_DN16820_c4_g1::TRINITY_DN16820_c4_g1_i3::g.151453::m.151453